MSLTGNAQKQNMDIQNQLVIKEQNLKRLFDLLLLHGEISRAALANLTGLSPTTVSALVDELLGCALVTISGTEHSHHIGRRAILLRLNAQRLHIPTIAWERQGFRYVLYDLQCNELESLFIPFDGATPDYVGELHRLIMEKSKKIDLEHIGALCITVPAVIDTHTRRLFSTVLNINGQEDFLNRIRDHFISRPVMIGNESAFSAYAEKEFALFGKANNIIYINIHEGVGAGIISQGKIYRGTNGMAGEFGHMSVDMDGPLCSCGNRGCLERLVSLPSIIDSVSKAILAGGTSVVSDYCGNQIVTITFEQVAQAFQAGDPLVDTVIQQVAAVLSFGIINLVRLFDPAVVVIGGGIERLGPAFLALVRTHMDTRGSRILDSAVEVRYTQLAQNCHNRGAAKYFIDNLMRISMDSDEVIVC